MLRHERLINLYNRDVVKELEKSHCAICFDDSTELETVQFDRDASLGSWSNKRKKCVSIA